MDFMLDLDLKKPPDQISYGNKILLTGSCFTEHIGKALSDLKFSVLQNPNGILFDPASVCQSLISYIRNDQFTKKDLFQLQEIWHSWLHHSRFSHLDPAKCIEGINESQQSAHDFLKQADWIVITLGSSFSYRLTEIANPTTGRQMAQLPGEKKGVANCHRAPAQWFDKFLLPTDEIISMLDNCYHRLLQFNPALKIIFTVSPVRHIRDGVIENNRSKARLLEAVHHLVNKFNRLYYFPAYELVIDVLRDYRFYDTDMVHPNYLATEFVLEKFTAMMMGEETVKLMQEIKKIMIARKHKPFQPGTQAHRRFLDSYLNKVKELQEQQPLIDLSEELNYFSSI